MDLPLELMQENAGRAAALLRSMANESRLMILCRLSQGEMTVGDLTRNINLSQSALSQHLGILRRENLVKTRRESQYVWYSLDSDEVKAVIETIYEVFCKDPEAGTEAGC